MKRIDSRAAGGRFPGGAVEHLVWDWNGTLFDDAWLCVAVVNGMLRRRGKPLITEASYRAVFDFPVREYYRRVGFDVEGGAFEALVVEFVEEYERRRLECRLQAGAERALAFMAERGLRQHVLSVYPQAGIEELAAHFGVRRYFARIVGRGDHYAWGKEEEARRLAGELGSDAARALLVGDTSHDVAAAKLMGARCVLVPGGHQDMDRLERCGVPVFDSLAHLVRAWRSGRR